MNCGPEPNGRNMTELGICPAATDDNSKSINKGKNGGRFCWTVAGTQCDGEIQGTFAKKFENCLKYKFYL
jgi:hypothetical protein